MNERDRYLGRWKMAQMEAWDRDCIDLVVKVPACRSTVYEFIREMSHRAKVRDTDTQVTQ